MSRFQHVKRQAPAIHARHVADAGSRLKALVEHMIPIESLYETRG